MDSKDSPSSSSALVVANRDAPPAEDDVVLSVVARDAGAAFHSGKFAECMDFLNQLLQKKEDDPKVLHNVAIARYFHDGCSDPQKLIEVLTNIKKRSDELAFASGDHADAVSSVESDTLSGSKGTDLAHSSSSITVYNDLDTSVLMLNMAVIWFHLHKYAKAYPILDSLYQKIEPIDEATALRICLLYLDVAFASEDLWKFIDVINYVERAYRVSNVVSQSDSGASMQQQSSNLVAKSSSFPNNPTATDASVTDSVATANVSEGLSRTLSEENLETLISTIDMSGQTLSRPSGLQPSNDLSRIPADHSITTSDLRLKLHLYKVRLLLLTRNLKAAKREVKTVMAMNVAHGKDSSMALHLKSQLEYARGNYRKAIKLLMASSNRTETGILSIFNNNLGCIYYRLGKYHSSAVFFSKALSNRSLLRQEKPLKLSTVAQDKSLQITYNCGVQYLACGKPLLAARCFYKASLIFYKWPLLWLRIAECCIMALEKGLLKSNSAQSNRSEVKVHVVGQGQGRHLAIRDGISANTEVDFVGKYDWPLWDDKQPNLSLILARQCLLNALHLLDCSETKYLKSGLLHSSASQENESKETASSKVTSYKNVSGGDSKASNLMVGSGLGNANGDAKEQKSGNSPNATLQSSILDYEDICRRQNQKIKQAVLADLAYVELALENPVKALAASRSLLELPEHSKIYTFLGNIYAAESLCLLNRPKEAAEHLLSYLSGGSNVEPPYSEEDREEWRAEKSIDSEEPNNGLLSAKNNSSLDEAQDFVILNPEEARGALCADLAVMFAMQEDLEQAQHFVAQALSSIPRSPEAILTAIFVDLVAGKTKEAVSKMKQYGRFTFLPSDTTTKSSSC